MMRDFIDMFRYFPVESFFLVALILLVIWVVVKMIQLLAIALLITVIIVVLIWIKDRFNRKR